MPPTPAGWITYCGQYFSIGYPQAASLDRQHDTVPTAKPGVHQVVAVLVPKALVEGTNLGSDSRLSVETTLRACNAHAFIDDLQSEGSERRSGLNWSTGSSTDAGAGNFYDEKIFVARANGHCLAVRYFIHSANIGNYPEGTVRPFDRNRLMALFDRMRTSVSVNSKSGICCQCLHNIDHLR